jgi:multisubunit Na+/H+ antiporter MnhC subunit
MPQKITLLSKIFIEKAAFKILAVFVNGSYVMIIKTKMSSANIAFEIIDFSVNSFYVPLEMKFKTKLCSANVVHKIFDIVVNNFNVSFEIIFRF